MRLARFVPALFAAALFVPRAAHAQLPDTTMWVTDGEVRAATRIANTFYVGGSFSHIGPATGCAVPFSATSAQPQQPFVRLAGNVNVVVPDGAGGWFVGGQFRGFAAPPQRNLVHILAGGTLAPWSPDPDSEVFALALSGSTLYVGGRFEHLGGAARFKIGAVSTSSGLATAFDPSPPKPSSSSWPFIRSLAVAPGAVYAGGFFLSIGAQPRSWLAKLDAATGVADAGFNAAANGQVLAMAYDSGTLYVGGNFINIGGQPRGHAAALDPATGLATAWDPALDAPIQAMALSGARVYVGGPFTLAAGLGRAGLAAYDRATGALTAFNAVLTRATGFGTLVTGIGTDDGPGGAVYVAGTFDHAGGVAHVGVAQLDPVTGAAFAWAPQINGTSDAVQSAGGTVFVGGRYGSVGGVARSNLAAIDLATGHPTAWAPLASDRVTDLVTDGSIIFASGYFTQVNGASHPYVARIDATSGAVASWNPGAPEVATCLALVGSRLYVGGYGLGSTLYAVDAVTGVHEPWSPVTSGGPINQIAPDVAGGAVTVASQGGFWRFRASDAALLWSAAIGSGAPFTVTQLGNTVYTGGNFGTVNATLRNNVAAFDATTGALLPWSPSANNIVYSLAHDGYHVHAAGMFASIGGQSRLGYAVLDPVSATATSDDVHLDGTAFRVFPLGADVFVGGLFSSASNLMTGGFARLPAAPPLGVGPPPRSSALQLAAWPAPARDHTELRFTLPAAARVFIDVTDAAGRRVAAPVAGEWRAAGAGTCELRTQGWAPGVPTLVTL